MYPKRLSWLSAEDYKKIADRVYDRVFSACIFKKRSGIYKKTPLLTMLLNNDGQFFREYLKLFKNEAMNFGNILDRGEMEFLLRSVYTLVSEKNFEIIDTFALKKDDKKYIDDFINRGRELVSILAKNYSWPDLKEFYDSKEKLIPAKKQEFIDWLKILKLDTLKIYLWIPKYDNGGSKASPTQSKAQPVNLDIQGTLPF